MGNRIIFIFYFFNIFLRSLSPPYRRGRKSRGSRGSRGSRERSHSRSGHKIYKNFINTSFPFLHSSSFCFSKIMLFQIEEDLIQENRGNRGSISDNYQDNDN